MFKVITHSQQFHLDELMAVALLELYVFKGEKFELIRTRDKTIVAAGQDDANTFVIDVGLKYDPAMRNFDHHQNDSSLCWPDGVPLSSCGMVWKWLRDSKILHQKMNDETMDIFERDFIRRVDMQDNGISKFSDCNFLVMYNRKPDDPREQDKQFMYALKAAKSHLINYFAYVRGNMKAEKSIVKAIKNSEQYKDIVVCDSNIKDAAKRIAQLTDKKMVIYPHSNGAWAIETVPLNANDEYSKKIPAPKEWLGLSGEALEKASGIKGLFFCHKGAFITMFRGDLDEAIKVARVMILKHEGHIQ